MSLQETFHGDEHGSRLARMRADGRQRQLVVLGGVLIGLGLGSLHWLGLVLGGAIISLPAQSIRRGLAYGFGLGVLELLVFGGMLTWQGALAPTLTTGVVGGITIGIGLGAPLLGSLVRAVV